MTSPAVELQRAIYQALKNDGALVAALGGGKIYDATPPNAIYPYITFGRTSMFDWSTGTEIGAEQLFTVHIWSKTRGKGEALEIMERVRELLSTDTIALPTNALINLTLEFAEARYDDDLMVHHAILRYRAVMEPV